MAALDDILITADLARRPARSPNYEAENRALADLTEALAAAPHTVPRKTVEAALDLCGAGSAGISVIRPGLGEAVRWSATVGQFAGHVGLRILHNDSPGGLAVARNASLLFSYPERYFDFGPPNSAPIVEMLVAPFHAAGNPAGVLWVMMHTASRKFDLQDQRVLVNLSRFAGSAYQVNAAANVHRNGDHVQQILEAAATGLTSCSKDLRYLSANPAYAKLAGLSLDQIVGRRIIDVIGSEAFEVIRPHIERVLRGERVEYEEEVPSAAGASRFLHVIYTPWIDSDGQVGGWVASASDVTDLKLATAALREREQRLRLALDASGAGSWAWDARNDRFEWDDRFRTRYGFTPEDPPTFKTWISSVHKEDRPHVFARLEEILQKKTTDDWSATFRIVRPDGVMLWIESVGRAERDAQGRVTRLTGLNMDITERRRNEEIAKKIKAEEALAQVRSALAEAQAEEACRIARELHDDIGQRLTLLTFEIQNLASGRPPSSAALAASLSSFRQKLLDIGEELRKISHQMHPSILEHVGLPKALMYLCTDFSSREEIRVQYHSDDAEKEIPSKVEFCLYRIAQEALRNVSKHAGASQVEVKLAMAGDAIQLSIADSGSGFDPSAVQSGLGLHSMRERAGLVNGSFLVASAPGSGTRITVTVPVRDRPPKAL